MNGIKGLAEQTNTNHLPFVSSKAFDEKFLSESDLLLFFKCLRLEDLKEDVIIRVYVNGKENPSKVFELVSSPPLAEDSLESWTQRFFGSEEFLVLVNRCEYLLNRFTERLFIDYVNYLPREILIDPLFKGIDLVLFLGRYNESPLGPHQDKDKISIVHFQVLGKKQFKFWNSDKFTSTPDQILEVGEGSAISFSGLNYHSAVSETLSASLSLGLTKFSTKGLFKEASETLISNVSKDLFDSGEKELYPSLTQVHKILDLPSYQFPVSLTYRRLIESYELKNKSGLFFIRPPKLSEVSIVEALKKNNIQLKKPNIIVSRKDGFYVDLYLRKHHLKIQSTDALNAFVDALNTHNIVQIQDHITVETLKFLGFMLRVDVWDHGS